MKEKIKILPQNNFISNISLKLNKKKQTKSNKFDKIKKSIKEWSLLSSLQCLPKVFQYENIFIRILWFIILIIFSFGTCFFLIRTIFDYLEFDVVSQIRVYNEQTLVYPVISICEVNPFTSKEAENILSECKIEDTNIYQKFNPEDFLGNLKIQTLASKFLNYLSYGMYRAFNLSDREKLSLGNSLKSRIQLCTFDNQPCDKNSFVWVFNYFYGNCIMFNSNKSIAKHTQISGSLYGLLVQMSNITNHNKYPTYYASGLRVFVTDTSFLTQSSQQTLIETGKATTIEIKKTLTHREPRPYSQCQDLSEFKSDLYDQLKKSGAIYRQTYCFELCLQRIIMEKCQCFSLTLPIFDGKSFRTCHNSSERSCLYDIIMKTSDKLEENCISECPLECDNVKYDLTSSTLTFPNDEFFQSIKNYSEEYTNMTLNEYRQSNLLLNIFFTSKEYTDIRDIPKISVIDLISNLGGVVGIFLGMSIFTCVEIIELILKIIFAWF